MEQREREGGRMRRTKREEERYRESERDGE